MGQAKHADPRPSIAKKAPHGHFSTRDAHKCAAQTRGITIDRREPAEDNPHCGRAQKMKIMLLAWEFVFLLLNDVKSDLSFEGFVGLQESLEEWFTSFVQEIIAHNCE